MEEKILKQGAEAILSQVKFNSIKVLSKKRIAKKYRDKKLDEKIRKKRTRQEAKILRELTSVVFVPSVLNVNENNCEIIMEFIEGKVLKEIIEKKQDLCKEAGKEIKKIHEQGIIHGDLTSSNILFSDNKLFFIDFGLGYFSQKIEDKATDLIVFKKTFQATHPSISKGWEKVLQGYKASKEMLSRMQAIEKRARYH
jgi:Kae1-associated kinase Bud32